MLSLVMEVNDNGNSISTSPSDPIDQLYALFNRIKENQSIDKSSENDSVFDKILSEYATASAEPHIKRLSAQLICRLLPGLNISDSHQKAAFNALIDLVEDDDSQTRRQVISGLPRLCLSSSATSTTNTSSRSNKDSNRINEYATKVSDVLVQLMQTDDDKELSLVEQSLLSVLSSAAQASIRAIFSQLSHPDLPEAARRRCIRFLSDRILCIDRCQMTPEVEEVIVEQVTTALEDVTEAEFTCFIKVLASLQCMQTVSGRQRLVDTICAQAIDAIDPTDSAEFEPQDLACVGRVRGCARQALPFLSKSIISDKFVTYYLDKVLPQLSQVSELADGDRPRLELMQQLAELSSHVSPDFKATDQQLSCLLNQLDSELPHHEDGSSKSATEYNFSHIESLLFAVHRLTQARQDYFGTNAGAFDALQNRLKHCQSASRSYQQSLKPSTDSTNSSAISIALAITSNICRLIEYLLLPKLLSRPPGQSESSAAASLTPSWLLGGQQKSRRRIAAPNIRPSDSDELSLNSPTKRPGRDSSDAAGLTTSRKRRAVDLPVYRPPVGKFSSAVGPMPKHSSAARGGRSRYYNVYTGAGAAASATAGRRSSGSGNR
ncbi:hypothetical protein BOX15_Mlig016967g1 [Macrostomum lignano]|uniref:Uncharacterized protein n=1 Tax=Macrostomum lignano TaxID=282301 RepID=A0A267GY34_9PLAT|nr:hypothetical protein BOX15_Mlig016967g1 [Macrostomum lignano]